MSDRRVLMITYFFPPIGGIGVQRTLKYATYLPTVGWTPVVIAPRNAIYRVMDEASVASLPPDLEIHRSFCYEPAHLRRQIARLARLFAGGAAPTDRTMGKAGEGPSGSPGRLNAVWARAIRLLFFPDEQLLWVPFAVRSAVAVHARRPTEAVYSSSGPISTHLIAGMIKRRTGLPWVADFRDPWIGNAFLPELPGFQRRLQIRIEKWIVEHADRAVFATPGLAARYRARYPGRADRFVVIPNGYDATELAGIQPAPRQPDPIMRLMYSGSLYTEPELTIFLEGLTLALSRHPDLGDRLRVEFLGWMTPKNYQEADQARRRLAPVLELSGQVSRSEALARLKAADAGLLLLADYPGRELAVAAKLFEYLGLDRQVLAAVPRGDARQILADLDWGIVADPEPSAVAAALERLVDAPPARRHADPEGRFERRRLAAQLGSVLDEVAGR